MARGTLRIYLGAAPGVGKTFDMLGEAHRRLSRGTDVVVGLVETHGRRRTAEQIEGLEVLPRKQVAHRGVTLTELDVDAVIRRHPDVVVLDLALPDLDGTEVLAGLRPWFPGPVLVLSARSDSRDKVDALDAGADDYVTKPFDMGELLARLRALQRRGTPEPEEPVVRTDHFTVDLAAKQVRVDGGVVRLTPTEWGLLSELLRAPGRLVGQRQLLQAVWGPAYEKETNYLRVYMAQLRRKLEPDPSNPRYLRAEPGMGYRFTP